MNSICKFKAQEGEIDRQYLGFENDLFGWDLTVNDPYFIFPVVIFVCNYFFLKTSTHPWLINYNVKKNSKLVYLSFFVSIFSIFWPKVFLSYINC